MIKRIAITNFRSLENVTVDLEPVTVLIGRSGSGKSNFVQAVRWLRDFLTTRNLDAAMQPHGHWRQVLYARPKSPLLFSFSVDFTAPRVGQMYSYLLEFRQNTPDTGMPQFAEERLALGDRVLFHQREGKWVQAPPLDQPPQAGVPLLGAITGFQEATIAHLVLTSGMGCYAFPDSILTSKNQAMHRSPDGFSDEGANFLKTLKDINVNLETWQHLKEIVAVLKRVKPSLSSLDLQQPDFQSVVVTLDVRDRKLLLPLEEESEGFRRLLACLLALYQTPVKQTVLFDEPEKGIYPAGLALLAEEFQNYGAKGRGQVVLTTHSPQFLDHFLPEQIRVVEMHNYSTSIGPLAEGQMDSIREQFLRPGELLTVDEARLSDAAPVG